jgi:hypothetical protein
MSNLSWQQRKKEEQNLQRKLKAALDKLARQLRKQCVDPGWIHALLPWGL